MKNVVPYFIAMVFAVVLFSDTRSFAQGPPGGGGPGPCTNPPCNPPHPPGLAPIDGGIVFLLVSGLLLGVSNLRKRKE